MRYIHRLISVFCCLTLLWIAGTGSIVESIDLYKHVSGAPETDLTMQSINDHKFGNSDYAAVTAQDFGAQSLPNGFDYRAAFGKLTGLLHQAKPGWKPEFIEVRVADGRPIGQAGTVALKPFSLSPVAAFDLTTGRPTKAVALPPTFPQPFTIRQRTKELHRFWISDDTFGGWISLINGLLFWVLIVTGLIVYFRLLKFRTTKLRKGNWFWSGGGDWWRVLHRWVSVVAAIFLVFYAATGTYLGFETAWHSIQPPRLSGTAAPLSDAEIDAMATATVQALRRDEPATPVRVMRLRVYSGMKQGVVVTGEEETRQFVYNAATGRAVSLTEPEYPVSGFPFGMYMHELMQHLHAGDLIGVPAIFLADLAGLALAFLSISGIVVYLSM